MLYEWDADKNQSNLTKHGIAFEVAQQVFSDPFAYSIQDRVVAGEERWQTIGSVDGALLILVAHTWIDEDAVQIVRLISARKATKTERKVYEDAINR